MNDLISRQAAIDSIEKHLRCGDELYLLTDTDKVLNHGFEIAASCVYNLPSVHPEQHLCHDCKWVKYYGNVDKNGNVESYWHCTNWDGGTDEEGYCHEWESR